MRELTQRQAEVLDVIRAHHARYGTSPTLREICAAMGFTSTNGASDHLRALVRKGYVERDEMLARGIRLTAKATGGRCPTCGHPMADDSVLQ